MTALLLMGPASALAQPVFFDDFDGNSLLPHWNQPPSSHWGYNVSNSMLNVTGLFYPSNPKAGGNFAGMGAPYAPLAGFQMDVWMGWDAGQQPHRLGIAVIGSPGGIIAEFGYRNEAWAGPNPLIFTGAGNQGISAPAPPPGLHHFTIARVETQYRFYLNGDLLWTTLGSVVPAAGVSFDFVGPYPGQLGAFHIDRVQVVPTPGTLRLLQVLALGCVRRRRRSG